MAIQRCAQWTGKNLSGKPARGAGVDPEFKMNLSTVIPSGAGWSRGTPEKNPTVVPQDPSTSLGMTSYRTLAILFLVTLGIVSPAFAQPDANFEKANQEYALGHFKEAISGYEDLVRAGQWSANLFYDLGNAYFRAGDFGHAILNYERAIALERHHPEAMANLQIARDEGRALELQQNWPERYFRLASVNQYCIAAAIAFWLAIFAVVSLIFARRRSATMIAVLVFCLLISAISTFAVYT